MQSTSHTLIKSIEHIKMYIYQTEFVYGPFIDSGKALDTIDHKTLIQKLNYSGIQSIYNKWF